MSGNTVAWLLDSGGAGRGAWQGGVIHEFMRWSRENGCYPQISMGASAGGYAAGDVATGTEKTVMKGWTAWGKDEFPELYPLPPGRVTAWPQSRFRRHLFASTRYVMGPTELEGIFDARPPRKLLIFVTRIRRRDGQAIGRCDLARFLLKSLTRKLTRALKYLPRGYREDPVVFASNLPAEMETEFVRPLTRHNYQQVLEASCLVPLAMGRALPPEELLAAGHLAVDVSDRGAAFIDGGYTLKMPMAIFEEDSRFQKLRRWSAADKTVVFCCDPQGNLWETSSRLRRLNAYPGVSAALSEGRMLLIYPDHKVEAGFLCLDNPAVMRTFRRGREQGERLLGSESVRRFFQTAV